MDKMDKIKELNQINVYTCRGNMVIMGFSCNSCMGKFMYKYKSTGVVLFVLKVERRVT